MKTSELKGDDLDVAVSRALGDNYSAEYMHLYGISYFSNWGYGGQIIEHERITIMYEPWPKPNGHWEAMMNAMQTYDGLEGDHEQEGPTPLIAAMRCFVCSKLGEEV